MKTFTQMILVFLWLLIPRYSFPALVVPEGLIAFNSTEGQAIFERSQNASFWKLMPYFTTEKGLAFCGVASAVMVLNASDLEQPVALEHAPYKIFDQDNFFTPSVLSITTPSKISHLGMSIEELASSLLMFGLKVKTVLGDTVDKSEFRQELVSTVRSSHQFVIVNFYRKHINERGGGHFSPIAAYDEKTDRFLLLDVARYKYPPVWVKSGDLFDAVRLGADGEVSNQRGYLVIG